jgi:hypothetical protein
MAMPIMIDSMKGCRTLPTGLQRVGSRSAMALLCALIALGGCTMTETQQRTASGAGIGAGVGAAGGALIGALTGNPGAGAAIGALSGAAVGGAGGYITDQQAKREQAQSDSAQLRQQNELLRLQLENERLKAQQQQQAQ